MPVRAEVIRLGQRVPPTEWVTRLVKRHDHALRNFLFKLLRSEADAADVAQESYLRLYRLSTPRDVRHPRALLFRTATNLAIKRLSCSERNKIVTMDPTDLDALGSHERSCENVAMYRQALDELSLAIKSLTPRRRQVLLMHKYLGMTNREIADELGITNSTVEQHMTRAIADCRKRMSRFDKLL